MARKLNTYFCMGLIFLMFAFLHEHFWNFLDPMTICALVALGIAFEAAGFYYNYKSGKSRMFTGRELEILTGDEREAQMRTASEMLQFARKYQKAEFKQYRLAFEEVAEHMRENEYAVFSMVGGSYTVNDNPGPWYAVLVVTDQRVILAGETARGRMLTRYVSDYYEREEIVSVKLVNRKLILSTTSRDQVKIEGEHLELMEERLREVLERGMAH